MSTADPVALVPLRDPRRAKSRLAPVLGDDERAAVVCAMLADVLGALVVAGVDHVVVLAAGDDAAAAAGALGVDVLRDPPGAAGIDAAIAAAGRRLRARSSLVVPADLALLRPEDVTAIVGHAGDVVVAPTSDAGTGGLLLRPAWAVATSYGPRSAARHLLTARQAGLRAIRADIDGFWLDVDDPVDLATAASSAHLGRVTARVLGGVDGLAERLAPFHSSDA